MFPKFPPVILVISVCMLCTALTSGCGPREARFNNGFCSVGTEELNTALDHWFDRWQKLRGGPDESVVTTRQTPKPIHEGRGNATAPAALAKAVCDLAAMSRPMQPPELDVLVREFGQRPVASARWLVPAH